MATVATPQPTPLFRLVHVETLPTLLVRGVLHSPTSTPDDGLPYRAIHNTEVQASRRLRAVVCGPGGTVHDYVPFYFGPLSPMLLNLKTNRVAGYTEGQAPLIYLVSSCQAVAAGGCPFVFTDGHGLATFTKWFDDLSQLGAVDWPLVRERYWGDKPEDNDRMRRKQAEFLVWQSLDWSFVTRICVLNPAMKERVEGILRLYPARKQVPVEVTPGLYYP
jgi:ssDNA thymidine ADP-ribosyltransferase, DarT